MTLTEFLLARIAEDEESAHEAGAGEWESWSHRGGNVELRDLVENQKRFAEVPSDRDEHIARHNPARVLAESEAKRRIVRISETAANRVPPKGDGYEEARARQTLRLLALSYADHRDYSPEWKP